MAWGPALQPCPSGVGKLVRPRGAVAERPRCRVLGVRVPRHPWLPALLPSSLRFPARGGRVWGSVSPRMTDGQVPAGASGKDRPPRCPPRAALLPPSSGLPTLPDAGPCPRVAVALLPVAYPPKPPCARVPPAAEVTHTAWPCSPSPRAGGHRHPRPLARTWVPSVHLQLNWSQVVACNSHFNMLKYYF